MFDDLGAANRRGCTGIVSESPAPRINLITPATAFKVLAAFPGLAKERMCILVDVSRLWLDAGVKPVAAREGNTVSRGERLTRKFFLGFALPPKLDGDRPSAGLENCIARLVLPK